MPYLARATDSDFRAIGREVFESIEEAEAWRSMHPDAIVSIVEVCEAGDPISNAGEDLTQP